MTSKISNKKDDKSKDKTLQKIVNYGTLIFIVFISYIIYIYFIERPYVRIRGESFKNYESFVNPKNIINTNTIYENSIISIFGDNIRLKCSMLPNLSNSPSDCLINNEAFVPYLFPIHMILLVNCDMICPAHACCGSSWGMLISTFADDVISFPSATLTIM